MKTPTTNPRLSKIALLTCLLTLAGCASEGLENTRHSGTAIGAEDRATQLISYCQRLKRDGDLANAAGFCERALEVDPTNEVALLTLARIFESRGATREAAKAYRAMLVMDPENTEARYGLGKSYVALEQYNLALEQLETALELGGDARIYNTLGVVNDQLGNHQSAQTAYRQGLATAPDNIPLQTNLGLSLVLSGRHGEGLMTLRKAATNPGAGSETRQALTFAYAIAGDMAAAEEMALVDLPVETAKANLAYYDGLREAGVGTPPPPPPEPMLGEALGANPTEVDPSIGRLSGEGIEPQTASLQGSEFGTSNDERKLMPLFDPQIANSVALADAEAAQRPWTEWGQLPNYGPTVAQLNELFPDEKEPASSEDETRTVLDGPDSPGFSQLVMAEAGLNSDAAPSQAGQPVSGAGIESSELPEAEDPYLSSLQELLSELPSSTYSSAGTGTGARIRRLEPMEAEAIPGMAEAEAEAKSARLQAPIIVDIPTPPKPPAAKTHTRKQLAMAASSQIGDDSDAPAQMARATEGRNFYAVQLGAFRSPEQAARSWLKIQSNATDLLGSLNPTFTRADLGEAKGVFYRLRIEPTNGRATAKELCGELTKRGIDCMVVKSEAPAPATKPVNAG